jgi:predicted secreted protein
MATVLAKNMKLYSGATPTAFTCQVDASISLSTNTFETTCKDSAANAEYLAGTKSWTASVSGLLDYAATNGWEEMFTAWTNSTTVALVFQTGTVGDKKYSGSAIITSMNLNSSGNDEAVTWDCEFQGTGALTEATIS